MKLTKYNAPDVLGTGDFLYPETASLTNYEGHILGAQLAYFFQMVNEMIFNRQQPGTFIDVGANYGIISRMAMNYSQFSQIDAFECNRKIISALEKNLKFFQNKLTNYNVIHSAVSNFNGTIDYTIPPDSDGCAGSRDMHGMNTGDSSKNVGNVTEKIDVVSLDSFYKDTADQISFIKIDVEGHELSVLQGAEGLIKKHRPVIVYELLELSKHQLTHKQLWRESGDKSMYWAKQLEGIGALLSDDPATAFLDERNYKHFVFPWSKCDILAIPGEYIE